MSDSESSIRTASDIYPSLSYQDARSAIEFLCDAFGFEKRIVVDGPDGGVTHSELSLGEGVIMVSSSKPEQGRVSPLDVKAVTQAICVRVEDPDAHYARARAAGAEIIQEIRNEEYGSRGYMARDFEGHQWYFSTYRPGAYWTS